MEAKGTKVVLFIPPLAPLSYPKWNIIWVSMNMLMRFEES